MVEQLLLPFVDDILAISLLKRRAAMAHFTGIIDSDVCILKGIGMLKVK